MHLHGNNWNEISMFVIGDYRRASIHASKLMSARKLECGTNWPFVKQYAIKSIHFNTFYALTERYAKIGNLLNQHHQQRHHRHHPLLPNVCLLMSDASMKMMLLIAIWKNPFCCHMASHHMVLYNKYTITVHYLFKTLQLHSKLMHRQCVGIMDRRTVSCFNQSR